MSATLGANCGISTGRNGVIQPVVCYDARGNGGVDIVSTITGDHENSVSDYSHVVVEPVYCLQGNGIDLADTAGCNGKGVKGDVCYTLNTIDRPAVVYAVDQGGGKSGANFHNDLSPTLTCTHGGDPVVAFQTYQKVTGPLMANSHPGSLAGKERIIVFDKEVYNSGGNATGGHYIAEGGPVPTIRATGNPPGVCVRYIVRRLTPLECERLQGFPDGWTDIGEWIDSKGKKHKPADSPRYKALGNSIAIPPWKWVLKRLCACYERDATMASLFDGIGGFPYIWEQLNGKGSCLWASEIEEFPITVTKLRFGGNEL